MDFGEEHLAWFRDLWTLFSHYNSLCPMNHGSPNCRAAYDALSSRTRLFTLWLRLSGFFSSSTTSDGLSLEEKGANQNLMFYPALLWMGKFKKGWNKKETACPVDGRIDPQWGEGTLTSAGLSRYVPPPTTFGILWFFCGICGILWPIWYVEGNCWSLQKDANFLACLAEFCLLLIFVAILAKPPCLSLPAQFGVGSVC